MLACGAGGRSRTPAANGRNPRPAAAPPAGLTNGSVVVANESVEKTSVRAAWVVVTV